MVGNFGFDFDFLGGAQGDEYSLVFSVVKYLVSENQVCFEFSFFFFLSGTLTMVILVFIIVGACCVCFNFFCLSRGSVEGLKHIGANFSRKCCHL